MTVNGTVGGVAKTATADLVVTPRTWGDQLIRHSEKDISPGKLTDPPQTEHQLGSMIPDVRPRADYPSLLKRVPVGGPNAGLGYVSEIPFELLMSTEINTLAMARGSAFWNKQPDPTQLGLCGREFITSTLLPLVHAHEGRSIADPFSHVQTFYQSFKDYIVIELANYVSVGPVPEERLVQLAMRARDNALSTSNAITHSKDFTPARFSCRLVY